VCGDLGSQRGLASVGLDSYYMNWEMGDEWNSLQIQHTPVITQHFMKLPKVQVKFSENKSQSKKQSFVSLYWNFSIESPHRTSRGATRACDAKKCWITMKIHGMLGAFRATDPRVELD
jgi:hypothetical protein